MKTVLMSRRARLETRKEEPNMRGYLQQDARSIEGRSRFVSF